MKSCITILAAIALLLSASLLNFPVAASPDGYPTAETPTLIASLSPRNATIGDDTTWLVWTDPNCSGCDVHLEIFDMTNWTTIYEEHKTLGTLNECGSLEKVISTVGFQEHEYRFTANMAIDDMEMTCSRYLDFEALFGIVAWVDPYEAVPGEIVELTIYESVYPYVDAVANITVCNFTHPSLWTLTDVTISSTNGTRLIDIPTAGLAAGSYSVNVTATSASGTDSWVSYLVLSDLIVTVDEYLYYIGQMVNVSINTYHTVSKAGLQISSIFPLPSIIVVDENVTLTNGQAHKLYNSSDWLPRDYYEVNCNATIDTETVYSFTGFSLEPFDVDVECDKYEYTAGEAVNITISTTKPQPSAEFNLTITNSTGAAIWTHGPSYLDLKGEASVEFDTTDFPPDTYEIEAFVNNTKYVQCAYEYFEIVVQTFDIFATVEPNNVGYTMPRLNTTVVSEQANAKLTIAVTSFVGTCYTFTKNLTISTYTYFIPAIGMPNGTYSVDVSVTSTVGTNSAWCQFSYSNGLDTDGDGLSDSQEQTIPTLKENPDSDGDGFFDGMEVFHGSDPLDPDSIIPEQIFMQILTLICISPLIYLIAKRTRGSIQIEKPRLQPRPHSSFESFQYPSNPNIGILENL